MSVESEEGREYAKIPMQSVGPIRIVGPEIDDSVMVPLATLESPLWPSVGRGAKVSTACGGIRAVVVDDRMTRSVLLEAPDAVRAVDIREALAAREGEAAEAVEATTRYGRLLALHVHLVGRLLYIRLEMQTGDAAGHNMVTQAADALIEWLRAEFSDLRYISISGNFCTDKKPSAVNGILGRGRSVIAELEVPRAICEKLLKTTPEAIAELNTKKNLVGSIAAGSLRSANAHVANMLLALYLATGQDAANIVEGSQGITQAEAASEGLRFSVTVPHLIVGTVGSGKDLPYVETNLDALGCRAPREPGANARRLALIAGATVLCGELSLLAAHANPGELMRARRAMERRA